MPATVTPTAYVVTVACAALAAVILCTAARRRRGPWRLVVARIIGLALAADAVSWIVSLIVAGDFSAKTSLPLALCNMAAIVAAAACWWRVPLLVELTYFWGLAGTLQAVITPDLNVGFPHLVFFEYMVGHLGIVLAAVFLVVGLGLRPRPRAVVRVLTVTLAYTGVVGLVDGLAGANYMFLRRPPANWTLLRLLGPWPWYLLSATGVALVLFTALDAPFWRGRRAAAVIARAAGGASDDAGVTGSVDVAADAVHAPGTLHGSPP
ncbi:MAG TPA: TIGR02206 family membrane protein [Acidimicrobiales bacterium]|nr:TIGR02206 family membrane protein [Acidimicrobiales bacterium]